MNLQKKNLARRERRKARINIKGTLERPRLSVFRSLQGVSAQIIDDKKGVTLVSAVFKDIKDKKNKTDLAHAVGKLLAERAATKNIKKVIFDRAGYQYHGRVKALADGAREGGLEF